MVLSVSTSQSIVNVQHSCPAYQQIAEQRPAASVRAEDDHFIFNQSNCFRQLSAAKPERLKRHSLCFQLDFQLGSNTIEFEFFNLSRQQAIIFSQTML